MPVRSQYRQEKGEVVSDNAMVAAECAEAAEAGREIFEQGGNAFDAAVATAFASCVCEPAMASLGGGGAALLYLADPGEVRSIEFEGRLSRAATEEMFVADLLPLGENPHPSFGWRGTRDNVGWMGYRSLGVPGQVAGLCQIQERYGSLRLADVLAPAIRLCEDGYTINQYYALMIASDMPLLQRNPPLAALLLPGGFPPVAATQYNDPTVIVQQALAGCLRQIAQGGADAFYRGDIARAIVADTQPHGAIVSLQDYADYEPTRYAGGLNGSYRGYDLVCMPDVFGGTQVLQMLNLLEGFDLRALGHNSPTYLHLLAECFRRAWVDRFRYIGDPQFEAVPLEGLISKAYANAMRPHLSLERVPEAILPGNPWAFQGDGQAPPASGRQLAPSGAGHNTTHLCTMDTRGNMVSLVQTLGGGFGAFVASESTGIILRNYTNLFNPEPGTTNSIGPWKRPTSHDSLTLVFKGGQPLITVGAPGGRRVITAVVQVLLNSIEFGMGIQEAIAAPRIHIEGADPKAPTGKLVRELQLDDRLPAETARALAALGHDVKPKPDGAFALPVGILRDPATGQLHGGVTVSVPAMAIGL